MGREELERDEILLAAKEVLRWVDDLWPYSEPGTEPAPCFQRLRKAVEAFNA